MLITARVNEIWLLGLKLAERILNCRHLVKGKYPENMQIRKRGPYRIVDICKTAWLLKNGQTLKEANP